MPENYTSATLGLGIDTKQFNRELSSTSLRTQAALQMMKRSADAFNDTWQDMTAGIKDTKRIVSGIVISQGFYLLSGALVEGASAALTFASNMEQAAISMEYFVDGADKANKAAAFLREMNEFAARTPFSTEEALSLSKYMQAVGVSMNVTKSFLQVITDTAAATGATEENMQRIVFALGQMMTKGRIAAEEIRQLANANVPIYEILQEELNLTGKQISNIGKYWIDADKATVAILRGLEKRYKGAADRVSDTFGGMVDTISDDLKIIAQEAGTGLYGTLTETVRGLRDTLDDYREVATTQGSMGLFEHIMEGIDDSGELRNEILILIGNIENLIQSGMNLASAAKPIIQIYGRSMHVAFNTAVGVITTLADAADDLMNILEDMGITSDMLVNTIGRLYIAYTAAKWLGTLGQAGMAGAQGLYNMAMGAAALLPASVRAQAGVVGLTASVFGLVGALALAYQLFTAFSASASGIEISGGGTSQEYMDAYAQYMKEMEEYNEAIAKYQDDFNKSYTEIDDGTNKAEDSLNDVKDTSKKAAASVKKDWVAAFDEVYAVPTDPTSGSGNSDKKTELPDLGALLKAPRYVFPELDLGALEKPTFDWPSILDNTPTTDWLKGMLPGLITMGVLGGLGNFFSKRRPDTDINAKRPKNAKLDSASSLKDVSSKLSEIGSKLDEQLKLTNTRMQELVSAVKMDNKYLTGGPDAKAIEGMTEQLRLTAKDLRKMLDEVNELRALAGKAPLDVSSDLSKLERAINEGTLTVIDRKLAALEASLKKEGLQLAAIDDIKKQIKTLTAQRTKIISATGEIGDGGLTYKELVKALDNKTPRLYAAFDNFSKALGKIEGVRTLESKHVTELVAALNDFKRIAGYLEDFTEFSTHTPSTPGLAAYDELKKVMSTIDQDIKILMKKNGAALEAMNEQITHIYNSNASREAQRQILEGRQYQSMFKAWSELGDISKKLQQNSVEGLAEQERIRKQLQSDAAQRVADREAQDAANQALIDAIKQERSTAIEEAAKRPLATDQSLTARALDNMTLQGRRVEDTLASIEEAVKNIDVKELRADIKELAEEALMANDNMRIFIEQNGGAIPTAGTAQPKWVELYAKNQEARDAAILSLRESLDIAADSGVELSKKTQKILQQLRKEFIGQEVLTTTSERIYAALKIAVRDSLASSGLAQNAADAIASAGFNADPGLKEIVKLLGKNERSYYLTGTATEGAVKGIGSFDTSFVSDIAKRLTNAGVAGLDKLFLDTANTNLRIIAALGNELEGIVTKLAADRLSSLQGQIMQGGFQASSSMPALTQIDSVLKLWNDTGKAFKLIPNDIKTKSAKAFQALMDASGETVGTIKYIKASVLKQLAPANYYQFALQAATNGSNSVGMSVFNRDFDFGDSTMVQRWLQQMQRTGLTNPYGNKLFSTEAINAFGAAGKFGSPEELVSAYMEKVIVPALTTSSGTFDFSPLADAYQQFVVQYTADELKALNLKGISKAYSQYGQLVTMLSNNNNLADFLNEWVKLDNGMQEAVAAINFTPVARHYRKMMNGHNKWVQDILNTEVTFSRGAIGKPLKKAVDKLVNDFNVALSEAASVEDIAKSVQGFQKSLSDLFDATEVFARGGQLDEAYTAIFEGTQKSLEDMRLLQRALTKISDNTTLVSDVPRMMRTVVDGVNKVNMKLASGEAIHLQDLMGLSKNMERLYDTLGLNMSQAVKKSMGQIESMIQITKRYGDTAVLNMEALGSIKLPFSILNIEDSLKYTAGSIQSAINDGLLTVAEEIRPQFNKLMQEIGPETLDNSFIGQLRRPSHTKSPWVLDLETTGTPIQTAAGTMNPRISQVGLYNTDTGKMYNWFVDWGDENSEILKRMQSILPNWESVTVEQLQTGKNVYKVLEEVKDLVGDDLVTGFNATNFSHAGGAFDARIVDSLVGSGKFNWGPDVMATALDDIRKAFGVSTHLKNVDLVRMLQGTVPEGAHFADVDAMLTGKSLNAIVDGKLDEIIEIARKSVDTGMPVNEALFSASDTVFGRAPGATQAMSDAAKNTAKNAGAAADVLEDVAENAAHTSKAGQIFNEAMDYGRRKVNSFSEAMRDFWFNTRSVDDMAEGPVTGMFKNWVNSLRNSIGKITNDAKVIDTDSILRMYEGLLNANEAFEPFKVSYAKAFGSFIDGAADVTDEAIGKAVETLQQALPNYEASARAYDRVVKQVAEGTLDTSSKNFKTVVREFTKAQRDYDKAMEGVAKAMASSSDETVSKIAQDYIAAHKVFSDTSEEFYKNLVEVTRAGIKHNANLDNVFKVTAQLLGDDTIEGGFKYLAYTMDPKTGAIKLLNDNLTTTGKEIYNAFFKTAQQSLEAAGYADISTDMIQNAFINMSKTMKGSVLGEVDDFTGSVASAMTRISSAMGEAGGDAAKLASLVDEFDDFTKALYKAINTMGNNTVILDAAGNIKYAGEAVREALEAMSSASSRAANMLNKAIAGWNNFGLFDVIGIGIGTSLQYGEDKSREKTMGQRMLTFDTSGIVAELFGQGINVGEILGDSLYNGTLAAFTQETVVAGIGAAVTTGIVAATGGTAGLAFLAASGVGALASIGSDIAMRATGSRSDSTLYLDDYTKALRDGTLMTEEMFGEIEQSLGRTLSEAERGDIERAARDTLNQDLIMGAKRNLWSSGNINQVLYGHDGKPYGSAGETQLTLRAAAAMGSLDIEALGIGSASFRDKTISYEGAEAETISSDQLVVKDIKGLKALEEVLGRTLKMGESTTVNGQTMYRVQYADTGTNVGTVSFKDLDVLGEAFTAIYRGGGAGGDILGEIKEVVGNNAAVNNAAMEKYGYGAALAEQNFDLLLDMYNSLNETNYSRTELEQSGGSLKLQEYGAQIFDAYANRAISQLGVAGEKTEYNANLSNLLNPDTNASAGNVQFAAFGQDLHGVLSSVLDDLKKEGITLTEGKYKYSSELTGGEAEDSYVTVNLDMDALKDEVRGWTIQPSNMDLSGLTLSSDDISILASMGIQIDAQNGTIDFMRPINEEVMGSERKLTLNADDFSQSVIESLEEYHFKLDFEAGELKIDNWDKVKDNMFGAMFKLPDSIKSGINGEAQKILDGIGTMMDSGYMMITNKAILNGEMTIAEYVASITDGEKKLSPEIMNALKNIDDLILQGGEDTQQAIIEWANGIVIPSPLDEDQVSEELKASFAAIGISFEKYGEEFLMVINQTGDHIKDGMVLIDKSKWDSLDAEIKQALQELGVTMTQEGNNILVDLNGTFANGVDDIIAIFVEQPDKWQQLPDTIKQWLMECGVVTTDEMIKLTTLTEGGVTQLTEGWLIAMNLLDQQTQDKMKEIFKNQGKECTDGFALITGAVDEANIPELLDDEIVVPFSELPEDIKKSLGDSATNMDGKYVLMKNSTAEATGAMLTSWTNANTNISAQANEMADNVAAAVSRAITEAERAGNIKVGSTGGFLGIGSTKNTIGDAKTIKVNGAEYTGYPEYDKNGKLVKWHYYDSTGKKYTTTNATVVSRAKGGIVDEDYTIAGERGREMAVLPDGSTTMLTSGLYDLPLGTKVLNHQDTEDVVRYAGGNARVRKLEEGNAEVSIDGADAETNQSLTEMVAAILKIMQNGTTLDDPDGVLDPSYVEIGADTKYIVESMEIAINGAVAAIIEAMYTDTATIVDALGKQEGFDFDAAFDSLVSTLDSGHSDITSILGSLDKSDSTAAILDEVAGIHASLDALFDELRNSIIEVKTATSEITSTQLDTVDNLSYKELVQIAAEIAAAREAYLTARTDEERMAAHDAAEAARARAGYSGGGDGSEVIGDSTYAELLNSMVASLVEMQGSMTLSDATTALLNDATMQSSYSIIENAKQLHDALVDKVQTEATNERKNTEATSIAIRTENTAAHRATEQVINTSANDLKGALINSFTGLQGALTDGLNRIASTVSEGLDRAAAYGYSNGYSAGYSAGSASNLGSSSGKSGTTMKFSGSTVIKANARGGLIEDDTLIRAGEFGRSEAVIPLEQPSIMEDVGATIGSYVDTEVNGEGLGAYVDYIVTSMEIAINGAVAALTEDRYAMNDQLTVSLNAFTEAVEAMKTEFGDDIKGIRSGVDDFKSEISGISSAISSLGSNDEAAATITAAIETLPETLAAILIELQPTHEVATPQQSGMSYDELVGIAADIAKARTMYANATTDEERAAAHDLAESARARAGYSGGADGSQVIGDSTYVELITTMVNALVALQESMNLSEATTTILNDAELQNSLAEIENAKMLAEQLSDTLQTEYNSSRKNVIDTTTGIRTDNTNAHRATEQVISSAANDLKGVLQNSFTALQTSLSQGLSEIASTVSAGLDRAAAYGYSNGYSAGYSAGSASNLGGSGKSGTATKFSGSTTIKANARGGLISEDTIIRAGEFGRSEAVIPLEQPSIMESVGAKIGSYVNTEDTNDLGAYVDYIVTSMEIAINGAVAALTEDSYTANESFREAIALLKEPMDALNTSLGDPIRNMSYDIGDLKSAVNNLSGNIDAIGSNADAADKICDALQTLPETMIAVLEQLYAAELEAMQTPTETLPNENDMSQLEAIYQVAQEIAEARNAYANATTDEERGAAHEAAEAARAKLGYSGGADGSDLSGDTTYAVLAENMAAIIANQLEPTSLSEVTTTLLNENENVNHEQLRELIEQSKKETVDRNDAIVNKLNADQTMVNTGLITDHKYTMVNTINAIAATLSAQIGAGFDSVNATVAAGIDRAASIGFSNGYSAGFSAGAASAMSSNLGGKKGAAMGGLVDQDALYRMGELGMSEAIIPLERPGVLKQVGEALGPYVTVDQMRLMKSMLGVVNGGIATAETFQRQQAVQETQSVDAIVQRVLESVLPAMSYNDDNNGESQRPLYVGTLVADDRGLKELERKLYVIRQAEETRR